MSTIISCHPINQSLHPTSSYCRQLHRYSKSTFYKYLNYISCCPKAWVIKYSKWCIRTFCRAWSLQKDENMSQGFRGCRKEGRKKHSEYALEINSGQWWIKEVIRTFFLSLLSSYLSAWTKQCVHDHPSSLTWHSRYSVPSGGRTKIEKEWRSFFVGRRGTPIRE